MRKLRIAFFSDMLIRNYDGCMRTVFNILDRKPKSVEIKFFTGKDAVSDLGHPYVGVPEVKIPFNTDYNMALPSMVTHNLIVELEAFKPDVIHVTSPSRLGQFAVNYAKRNRLPITSIYHTHFLSYMDYYFRNARFLLPLAKRFVSRQTQQFYNACSTVLVPTQEMIKELSSLGVQKDRMKLWPRGLDHFIFNPKKRDLTCLQALTGNTKPNLLFASRLVWEKNLKTLVDIYKEIKKEGGYYNLLIVGDGNAAEELKKQLPTAFFLGKKSQEELATIYASSDVFVFPSVSETYGNVVVEAMACGLPCVVADGGGSKSFITNGVNGYAVRPFEAKAYMAKVKMLTEYKRHSEAVSEAGIRYTANLSWDRLVLKFYTELKGLWLRELIQAA